MPSNFISLKKSLVIVIVSMSIALIGLISAWSIMPSSPVSAADIKGNLCGGTGLDLNSSGECQGGSINAAGACVDASGAVVDASRCKAESSFNKLVTTIINVFSVIVGIIAVIMIIVGGFKFITSGGDSGKVTSARNTIIYAIIGLIIVALAQTIARFVLSSV